MAKEYCGSSFEYLNKVAVDFHHCILKKLSICFVNVYFRFPPPPLHSCYPHPTLMSTTRTVGYRHRLLFHIASPVCLFVLHEN